MDQIRAVWTFSTRSFRVRCPSIFGSIAILGHGLKNAGSVLYDICAPGTRTFYVRLHHSIFAYLGGNTIVYNLYYR